MFKTHDPQEHRTRKNLTKNKRIWSNAMANKPLIMLTRRRLQAVFISVVSAFILVYVSSTNDKMTEIVLPFVAIKLNKMAHWVLPHENDCNLTVTNQSVFLTVQKRGRLGNQMFEYATLLGAAAGNGKTPVLDIEFYQLMDIFNISLTPCYWKPPNLVGIEENYTEVEQTVKALKFLPEGNVILMGVFQSFHHFDNVRKQVQKEFTFKNHISRAAKDIIDTATPLEWKDKEFIRVGIHVRRSDLISSKWIKKGFILLNDTYFDRAMDHFTRIYKRVQFLVASDDIQWCESHVRSLDENVNVYYIKGNTAPVDMAVLVKCDHVIITQGTFSWWVGWLNQGVTIYPKSYPPNNTMASKMHQPKYYFPHDEHNTWLPV